jgi:ABC-type Fe3+-citrate transport system substrate-binding protein
MNKISLVLCVSILLTAGCSQENQTQESQADNVVEAPAETITEIETTPTEEEPVVYVDKRTPEEKARLAAEGERMRAASVEKEKERQRYAQQNTRVESSSSDKQFYVGSSVYEVCSSITNITLGYAMITASTFKTSVNSIEFLNTDPRPYGCNVVLDTPTGPRSCFVGSVVRVGNKFSAHITEHQIRAVCH